MQTKRLFWSPSIVCSHFQLHVAFFPIFALWAHIFHIDLLGCESCVATSMCPPNVFTSPYCPGLLFKKQKKWPPAPPPPAPLVRHVLSPRASLCIGPPAPMKPNHLHMLWLSHLHLGPTDTQQTLSYPLSRVRSCARSRSRSRSLSFFLFLSLSFSLMLSLSSSLSFLLSSLSLSLSPFFFVSLFSLLTFHSSLTSPATSRRTL